MASVPIAVNELGVGGLQSALPGMSNGLSSSLEPRLLPFCSLPSGEREAAQLGFINNTSFYQ